MKKLLSILLVALLAIGALSLAACFPSNTPETPDEGGNETPASEPSIADAKEFLLGYLEDEATVTPADYTLPAQVKVGDYTYTVTWTVDREDITITVENGLAKIDLNEKTPEAFEYTLTATISYGELTPDTVTRTCSVPAYEVLSYADYVALAKGEVATIEGVIVMINSKDAGNKYNRITLVDANGNNGYYCHNLKKDPIKDLGLEIGMTVSVTGTTDDYNGMRQLKDGEVKIVNAEKTETPAVDVTAAFAAGTDLSGYIGNLVTIKGVTIGRQVLGGTNEYLYFSIGTVEGYLRTYVTDFPHTMNHAATDNADKNTIDEFHAANFGNTADVTGVLVRYGANFYLVPMNTTPFTNITVVELSDEDKVDATLDEVTFEESLSSDKVIEVALTGKAFNTVTLAWASNNAAIVYADGKLTVTIPEDETTVEITVTATLGEVTKTKTFTVKLSKSITSVADVLAVANTKEHNTYTSEKYIISGVISGITGAYGNCYVTDESGATIYVYGLYVDGAKYGDATAAKPVDGNYVVLTGVVGTYNGTAQMKNADLMSFSTVTSVTDAIALGAAKEHNTFTEETYVITGVVESIANTTYGNLYIQDADGNKIYVYGLYNQAKVRFDAMANQPKVGDTITVVSVVGNYNGAQLKNATVVCIVEGTVTPDPEPDPDPTPDPEVPPVAGENVELTVDSLALPSQNYSASTVTVNGVTFEFVQLGNYGDGIQMRDKDGKTSMLWNTTAFAKAIARIELVYSDTKDVTHSNPDAVIFTFGNEMKGATYTTKLSTTAGTKTYTITPDAETYTFFMLEHDLGYSMYWKSITIVYADGTTDPIVPPHEHNFVEGKCECGAEDPNYVPPVDPTPDTHVCEDADANYICDAADCDKVVAPAADSVLTIPQAVALATAMGDAYTTNKYYITGRLVDISNTFYGNFNIQDADGNKLYVYGLKSATGEGNFSNLDPQPAVGDEITIYTVVGCYKGAPQAKDAWLDELVQHTEHTYAPATCKVAATCTICGKVEGEPLDHTYENGVCTGCGKTEPAQGTTVTSTEPFAGLSQSGSYKTVTTTSGWTATNAAVLVGGTTDSNPVFKFIGDSASTVAITLNGKTSTVGKLTSATLHNGISKLSFNYGNAFSESNGVDITINIIQNGQVVATTRLDNNSVTQKTAYEFVWELDTVVEGDFVIEIVNNSPSNNASNNKDRVSIFNFTWVSAPVTEE